ncbi:MAG: polysaccharide deacetylase family protein [Oscillospiraceae bacterium]|nr:polysaccharide deacetylase family protein [Oscillospiraceae bacterium]
MKIPKTLKTLILAAIVITLAACTSVPVEHPPVTTTQASTQEVVTTEETTAESNTNTIDPSKPLVALTLDDGPCTTITVQILDILEERGLVATFFVIGQNINDQTVPIMERGYAMGCEYANHSWVHSSMGGMSYEEIVENVTKTEDKIAEVLGEAARPKYFRPPNLNTSTLLIDTLKELGYPMMQGFMGNDWTNNSSEQIYNLIVPKISDGSIILLHDGSSFKNTPEAVEMIIDELLEQGYQFVTVSELFEIKGINPQPGLNYNNVWGTWE